MKPEKKSLGTVLVLALLLAAVGPAAAAADDATHAQQSAEWWQVMLPIPTAQNPMLDTTGAECMVGHRGLVWFLASSFAGGKAKLTRTCNVPEGKAIFFPVVNSVWVNTPGLCGSPDTPQTVEELREGTAGDIAAATGMQAQVDGKVNKAGTRTQSPVFEVFLPKKNVFDHPWAPGGFPGGVYSPAVADGCYVLRDPLPEGIHTGRVQGSMGTSFHLDVTYKLTVVPVAMQ